MISLDNNLPSNSQDEDKSGNNAGTLLITSSAVDDNDGYDGEKS